MLLGRCKFTQFMHIFKTITYKHNIKVLNLKLIITKSALDVCLVSTFALCDCKVHESIYCSDLFEKREIVWGWSMSALKEVPHLHFEF